MGVLRLNGKAYGGGIDVIEVTQAQYNALPESKLSDDILYVISDSVNGSDGYPPLIYSDEEREIGVWRDGKPLYQKTWDFESVITVNSNAWTDVPISNSDIESIVKVVGGNLYSGKVTCWDGLSATADSGSVIKILQSRNVAINVRYLTLQYTKTTDTKGSGIWTTQGTLAQHYSTTERLIGTWIDGKPVYEKTIEIASLPSTTGSFVMYDTGITNMKKVVNAYGMAYFSNGNHSPIPYAVDNLQGQMGMTVSTSTGKIGILVGMDRSSVSAIVTIKYTKTTD